MSEGSRSPPPGPPAGGKRPAIGLQIRLPCASFEDVKARYGDELRQGHFLIRTKTPRPKDTMVRLETQLSSGEPAFQAVALVSGLVETGMRLQLLAVDEAAQTLIAELGGKPLPGLRLDARAASAA